MKIYMLGFNNRWYQPKQKGKGEKDGKGKNNICM